MTLFESEIIVAHSFGSSLAKFRDIYNTIIAKGQEQHAKRTEKRLLQLLITLQINSICFELFSRRCENLFDDIVWFISAVRSGQFEVDNLYSLLKAICDEKPDELIWDKMYEIVIELTSSPRFVLFFQQTFRRYNTSNIVNSSEYRKYFDAVLKKKLGDLYVNVPEFYEKFFSSIELLELTARAVFDRCSEEKGENFLYNKKSDWRDFSESTKKKNMMKWFLKKVDKFIHLYEKYAFDRKIQRRFRAQFNKPIGDSTVVRKLNIDVVKFKNNMKLEWSQVRIILVEFD